MISRLDQAVEANFFTLAAAIKKTLRRKHAKQLGALRNRLRAAASRALETALKIRMAELEERRAAELIEALGRLNAAAAEQFRAAEESAVELALAIARKLTLDSPEGTKTILLNEIRNKLCSGLTAEPRRLQVNKNSHKGAADLIRSHGLPESVLVINPNLKDGEARIEIPEGCLEFNLERRFSAIAANLKTTLTERG